jgi:hypothetical protein
MVATTFVRPANIPEQTPTTGHVQPQARRRTSTRNAEPLEFVEGDDV